MQLFRLGIRHTVFGVLLIIGSISNLYADSQKTSFAITSGFETWKFQNENMGMTRLGLRQDFSDGWHAGVESYTAMTGERGGFITLGMAGGYDYWIRPRWAIESGIFIGGGGGRGGYELTGGGLMLREHLGLKYVYSNHWHWSLGYSHVHFPEGGRINSEQIYLGVHIPFTALTENSQLRPEKRYFASNEWQFDRHFNHQFGIKVRDLNIPTSVKTDNGLAQTNFGTLGFEWRTYINDQWFAKVESAGAYQGNSRGYMHILAGMGYRQTIHPRWSIYSSLSTGGGGGGAVDTGGGWLFDADLGIQYQLARHWYLDTAISRFWASDGSFRSRSLNIQIAYLFGPEKKLEASSNTMDYFMSHPLRIRMVHQNYQKGSENWRTRPNQDVDNLGAQLDYFLSPAIYLTGQGLGAYAGDAGAYMVGLIGAGLRKPLTQKLFTEVETLVGAAGGGGLNTGSGTVVQSNLNLGYQITKPLEVLGGIGYMKSLNGEFKAHVIGLSLAYKFNILSAR